MDQSWIIYLAAHLGSLLISIGLTIYCLRHRSVPGASEYGLLAITRVVACILFLLQLFSTSLSAKLLWNDLQWFPVTFGPVALFLFTMTYIGRSVQSPIRLFALLYALPFTLGVLSAIVPALHLLRSDVHLVLNYPFPELRYEYTTITFLVVAYFYTLRFISIGLLAIYFFRCHPLYRRQVATVILAALFPMIGALATVYGLKWRVQGDLRPLMDAVGHLSMLWGLFRYRLLDLLPVAHYALFQNMGDSVIVTDTRNRLIDLNPAAQQGLMRPASELIGKPLEEVYAQYADLVEQFKTVTEISTEIQTNGPAGVRYYEVRITPLRDAVGRITGRLSIAHDITKRKITEQAEREQRTLTEALIDISKALNSTLDLDEVFERILLNIEKVVTYKRASIILVQGDQMVVVGHRHMDFDGRGLKLGVLGPVDQIPILKYVVDSKETLLIPDMAAIDKHPILKRSTLLNTSWIKSYLATPISVGDQLVGLYSLAHDTPGFYTSKDAQRLEAFAEQAAIALENARLYKLSKQAAVTEERQRLARDIHDSVSQTIFATRSTTELMQRAVHTNPQQAEQYADEVVRLTKAAQSELRTLMLELRPGALQQTDLGILLRLLCDSFSSNTNVEMSLSVPNPLFLPREMHIAYYRIAQEALSNISRHAEASAVALRIEQIGETFKMTISDNGRGFDSANVSSERLGLKLMQEHASSIHATIDIRSQKNGGTILHLVGAVDDNTVDAG